MIRTGSVSPTSADKLPAYVVTALGLTLAALAVWLSRVSIVGFAILAVLLLALIAYASLQWPRTVLVLVAMSAILDRYVVAGLLPTSYGFATHITSETLLAVAGITITWTAWQTGTFLTAFRHRATIHPGGAKPGQGGLCGENGEVLGCERTQPGRLGILCGKGLA